MGSLFGGKAKTPKVTLPAAPVTAPDAITERKLGADGEEDGQDLTGGVKKRGKASLKINRETQAAASTAGANYGTTATTSG